jgi:hypothetical protein
LATYISLIFMRSILYVFIIFDPNNIFDGNVFFYEDGLLNTSQILMVWEFGNFKFT